MFKARFSGAKQRLRPRSNGRERGASNPNHGQEVPVTPARIEQKHLYRVIFQWTHAVLLECLYGNHEAAARCPQPHPYVLRLSSILFFLFLPPSSLLPFQSLRSPFIFVISVSVLLLVAISIRTTLAFAIDISKMEDPYIEIQIAEERKRAAGAASPAPSTSTLGPSESPEPDTNPNISEDAVEETPLLDKTPEDTPMDKPQENASTDEQDPLGSPSDMREKMEQLCHQAGSDSEGDEQNRGRLRARGSPVPKKYSPSRQFPTKAPAPGASTPEEVARSPQDPRSASEEPDRMETSGSESGEVAAGRSAVDLGRDGMLGCDAVTPKDMRYSAVSQRDGLPELMETSLAGLCRRSGLDTDDKLPNYGTFTIDSADGTDYGGSSPRDDSPAGFSFSECQFSPLAARGGEPEPLDSRLDRAADAPEGLHDSLGNQTHGIWPEPMETSPVGCSPASSSSTRHDILASLGLDQSKPASEAEDATDYDGSSPSGCSTAGFPPSQCPFSPFTANGRSGRDLQSWDSPLSPPSEESPEFPGSQTGRDSPEPMQTSPTGDSLAGGGSEENQLPRWLVLSHETSASEPAEDFNRTESPSYGAVDWVPLVLTGSRGSSQRNDTSRPGESHTSGTSEFQNLTMCDSRAQQTQPMTLDSPVSYIYPDDIAERFDPLCVSIPFSS
jgi:hypothetical protein